MVQQPGQEPADVGVLKPAGRWPARSGGQDQRGSAGTVGGLHQLAAALGVQPIEDGCVHGHFLWLGAAGMRVPTPHRNTTCRAATLDKPLTRARPRISAGGGWGHSPFGVFRHRCPVDTVNGTTVNGIPGGRSYGVDLGGS